MMRAFLRACPGLALLSLWSLPALAQESDYCQAEPADGVLRIAVVSRRDAAEGANHYKGVAQACRDHTENDGGHPVALERHVYDDDAEGFAQVSRIVAEGKTHVVLGPTDSGVFADLNEFLYQPADQTVAQPTPIPIISSLVTVDVGNEQDGWFFRTNVDAVSRAQRIYEFLADRGVEHIAVLYAGSKFGEIAETAFRDELSDVQRKAYFAERFSDDNELRAAVRLVLARRPGAIGVFGSRAQIKRAADLGKRLHHEWHAYEPYLFTIIDTRSTGVENVHFLSVSGPTKADGTAVDGEVMGLSYDTMKLVLLIANQMDTAPGDPQWREQFRKRWVGLMSGSRTARGPRTGMEFDDMRNQVTPGVMVLRDGVVTKVTDTAESPWLNVTRQWLEMRQRRFGEAPAFNLALIAIIVALLTFVDLKRSHSVPGLDFLHPTFMLLVLFNVSIACLVFVMLAEQQVLNWDQPFSALLVAFGYSGLLKTTIFETEAGKSFGAKRYYNQLVEWIYGRIRRRKFERDGPVINYIAFCNSRTHMKRTLEESYGFARSPERKQALMDGLKAAVDKEDTTLGKRQVYARALIEELHWQKMIERRIVPNDSTRRTLLDPIPIVDDAASHCMRNPDKHIEELEAQVREDLHIRKHAEPDHAPLETEFNDELREGTTPRSQWAVCIRWLILLRGLDIQWLVDNDYLGDGYTPARSVSSILGRWPGITGPGTYVRKVAQPASPPADAASPPAAAAAAEPAQAAEAAKKGETRLVRTSPS